MNVEDFDPGSFSVGNRCMQEPKCDEFISLRKEVDRLKKVEMRHEGRWLIFLGFVCFIALGFACIATMIILS